MKEVRWAVLTVLLGVTGCAATAPGAYWTKVGADGAAVHLEGDVAAAYARYRDVLAPYGRWSGDSLAGAHWCPSQAAGDAARSGDGPRDDDSRFRPYRSGGHWSGLSAAAATFYRATKGEPVWVSSSGSVWEEVTLHHGRWTQPDEEPDGTWCWVPGTAATPAAVVWRAGDGFVGWAPEPADDFDHGDADQLSWSYEFLASLFEDVLDSQLLSGDAADQAASSTGPGPAPRAGEVASAHRKLADYVHDHRGAGSGQGGAHGPKENGAVAESGGSSASHESSASSSHQTTGSSSHGKPHVTVMVTDPEDEPLPPGMALYRSLAQPPASGSLASSPYDWTRYDVSGVRAPGRAAATTKTAPQGGYAFEAHEGGSSSSSHGSSSSHHASSSHSSSGSHGSHHR